MLHGTYKKNTLAAALLLTTIPSYAVVSNVSFEDWTGNTPNNWSTIDSGITVSAASNIVNTDTLAARVVVTTGSQSNTDLLQNVQLESGQTYTFSTWVYHTEGGVKARLLVNGYQGYSNNGQTNQWQDLSFSYTATENKDINVGLRFYDVTGFDGSETVYVDNFRPMVAVTPPPPSWPTRAGSCALARPPSWTNPRPAHRLLAARARRLRHAPDGRAAAPTRTSPQLAHSPATARPYGCACW